MTWMQNTNPLDNVWLSVISAMLPILFFFWALIVRKMAGYKAGFLAVLLAMIIAISVFGMPINMALMSTGNGILYGLFPICWIIITAVFLFNITVASGYFKIIRQFMATVTEDRRLQALLIAFSFGSFLEGTAGFGAPVAITAAMLVGLGFNPIYAAGICLIANTAPVAFGAIGTPIIVAAQVSDIPEMAISQIVGRTLPVLSLIVPFYLVILMAGVRKTLEVFPAILVAGSSFALLQWYSSNFLGPNLPDIISGVGSIICLLIFLRFWKPEQIWRFENDPEILKDNSPSHSSIEIFRAWSPYIILTILMIGWGLQPVKSVLDGWGEAQFSMKQLGGIIYSSDGSPLIHNFKFNYLSAAGTGILVAAIVSMPIIGISFSRGLKIFISTLKQLKFAILTIGLVLGFAYILNDSGMTITMANALAGTGWVFPLFSPLLGWLGVFITGSDTSGNALFGKLQATTASSIGVDPVVTVGGNACGGVVGKMISPQSIAVATGSVGLVGEESELFRFTVKHSFIMLSFISIIVFLQAYFLPWIIPTYTMMSETQTDTSSVDPIGYFYLGIMGITVLVIWGISKFFKT